MRVAIVGGWNNNDPEAKKWQLELDDTQKRELQNFCRMLGQALARLKHRVIVGSDDKEKSADYYVVHGMLLELDRQENPEPSIEVIQGIESNKRLYNEERSSEKLGRLFTSNVPPTSNQWPRAAAKILSIQRADVVITIGGLTDTYIAGIATLVARKKLVPVAVFGGASRELLFAAKTLAGSRHSEALDALYDNAPDANLVQTVLRLGSLDRPRAFLGYCSLASTTAAQIRVYLESIGIVVEDWAIDFEAGEIILAELQEAARSCKYGVFLFTSDDTLAGPENHRVPRANVVFEAGYFMSLQGPERTAIIVEDGTTLLADLGGYIYISLKDRDDISQIKSPLRKVFASDLQ